MRARALAWPLLVGSLGVACQAAPSSRLETLRDDLVRGDLRAVAALASTAECHAGEAVAASTRSCLTSLTRALRKGGSFTDAPPDDASLGAVALYLTRTRRGDLVANADEWLAALAGATGAGADALRLVVAGRMAEETSATRKHVHDEATARAFSAAVARAIPGSCAGYAAGSVVTADALACAARDAARLGVVPSRRANGAPAEAMAAGAAGLWDAASNALDLGQDRMTGDARVALGRSLGLVRVATRELEERRSTEAGPSATTEAGSAR